MPSGGISSILIRAETGCLFQPERWYGFLVFFAGKGYYVASSSCSYTSGHLITIQDAVDDFLSCLLHHQGVCVMTTAFLHFFFLASFCWVLTEAWQSYMAVTGKVRTRLIRKRFLCLGWGE